jgi:hypothetical protein
MLVIARFDKFSIHHIYRHENSMANDLAQQALGYIVSNKNFSITKKLMCACVRNIESLSVVGAKTGLTDSPIGLTSVPGAQTGLTDLPTGLISPADPNSPVFENSASNGLELGKADLVDWRRPIIDYLQDPSQKLIEKFRDLLSSSHWWMGICIAELLLICF